LSGLKKYEPALRFGQLGTEPPVGAITPDEIDDYVVYNVINPTQGASGAGAAWVGTTVVAGTSAVEAIVVRNAILDYPRNLEFAIAGSHAAMSGTVVVNGRDQFGSVISESIGITSASNGGTTVGTKVFAHFTSGTVTFGTAVGNGTSRLGVGTTGTTALFGLPVRLGGTTDVKLLTLTAGTGALSVNGGTIAAFVDQPMSAIKAPVNVTGTYTLSAWVRPTFNPEAYSRNADLPQRT
jgi:hypothetical protein